MKPSVYLETSIVSYLAAWPSRDLIVAANQQITHSWWRSRRRAFDVLTSQWVLDEAARGDRDAARRRLALLQDMPLVEVTAEAHKLAAALMTQAGLAPRAEADALHIALAAVHGVEYLLTWNCTDIANAELRPRVEQACRFLGYRPPVLCTPAELMGEIHHE